YGLNALWFFNRRTKPFAPMLLFGIGANHQMLNDVGRRCYLDSSGSGSNPMPNTGLKLYGRFGLGVLFAPRDWSGAPRHMEWYGAFALMVTLIWLYLEILRLLSNTRR
ncbi:MAG: Bax inhibitor-1/YccA family membrane protein, partial [Gammaproteobacteria bacterium]